MSTVVQLQPGNPVDHKTKQCFLLNTVDSVKLLHVEGIDCEIFLWLVFLVFCGVFFLPASKLQFQTVYTESVVSY